MSIPDDPCGTCTMCCKLLGIGDEFRGQPFKKPAGIWCEHCAIGKGCKVYDERPPTCRDFECAYLTAVLMGAPVPLELRPDQCGVVIHSTTDEKILAVSLDKSKPDAWRREPVYSYILGAATKGYSLTISLPYSRKKLNLSMKRNRFILEEQQFTEPDEHGMQWSVPGTEKFVEELRQSTPRRDKRS